MIEIWKDVPSFELYYKCSNLGNIFSKRRKRIINGYIDNGGYISLTLTKHGTKWKQRKSRIIYRTFVDNTIIETDLIHHIDENKINDNVSNLQKTNRIEHKKIHNIIGIKTRFKAKYHFNISEIIKLYEKYSTTKIAKMKKCNQKTIERIIKKEKGSLYNHYRKI